MKTFDALPEAVQDVLRVETLVTYSLIEHLREHNDISAPALTLALASAFATLVHEVDEKMDPAKAFAGALSVLAHRRMETSDLDLMRTQAVLRGEEKKPHAVDAFDEIEAAASKNPTMPEDTL